MLISIKKMKNAPNRHIICNKRAGWTTNRVFNKIILSCR